MKQFEQILNWNLLDGSHEFPGPDGGTCINEAAIVAAGFPYKRVNGLADIPKCFDPVIAVFALNLNDTLRFRDRQKLLPFVGRLAGTYRDADTSKKRAEFLRCHTDRIYPKFTSMDKMMLADHKIYFGLLGGSRSLGRAIGRAIHMDRLKIGSALWRLDAIIQMAPGKAIDHKIIAKRMETIKPKKRALQVA